jgi:bifunctional NMN adenylyltransferase/nudix hydrolase
VRRIHIVIGRFQPVHNMHVALIRRAAVDCDRLLILLGSSNQPASLRNPWSWGEREQMIGGAIPDIMHVRYRPLRDVPGDDDEWCAHVRDVIERFAALEFQGEPVATRLFGVQKHGDDSAYYLRLFHEAELLDPSTFERIDASAVRAAIFAPSVTHVPDTVKAMVPRSVALHLQSYLFTEEYRNLAGAPHAPL